METMSGKLKSKFRLMFQVMLHIYTVGLTFPLLPFMSVSWEIRVL